MSETHANTLAGEDEVRSKHTSDPPADERNPEQTLNDIYNRDSILQSFENVIALNSDISNRLIPYIKQVLKEIGSTRDSLGFITNEEPVGVFENVHPSDCLLVALHTCDENLKSLLFKKLLHNCYAVPVLIKSPSPRLSDGHLSLMRYLDYVKLRWWDKEGCGQASYIKDCTFQAVLGFCRLGELSTVLKSKLLNGMLSEVCHPVFFTRDCPNSTHTRDLAKGSIELYCQLPGGKKETPYQFPAVYLNLRGDGLQAKVPMNILSKVCSIIVIFVEYSKLVEQDVLTVITSFSKSSKLVICIDRGINTNLSEDEKQGKKELSDITKHLGNRCKIIRTFDKFYRQKNIPSIREDLARAVASLIELSVNETVSLSELRCYGSETEGQSDIHQLPFRNELDVKAPSKLDVLPLHKFMQSGQTGKSIEPTSFHVASCFINTLNSLKPAEQQTYISRVKAYIDSNTMRVVIDARNKYAEVWTNLQNLKSSTDANSDHIEKAKDQVIVAEQELMDSFFEIQDVYREVAYMYQIITNSSYSLTETLQKNITITIVDVMTSLLMRGEKVELFDAETKFIPIAFLEALFMSLHNRLENGKFRILSIVGVQTSGKTTLLNNLFGLDLNTGPGRCSRGISLVMIRSDNNGFLLIADTEGFRTPDTREAAMNKDIDIAAFCVAFSDILLVNLMGENYVESLNVIELSLARILSSDDITNETCQRKKRCIFVHQNVSSNNAPEIMALGHSNMCTGLDKAAKQYAQQYNRGLVKSFDDIMETDSRLDVFHLPGYWCGQPPLAFVSSGYSMTVQKLYERISDILDDIPGMLPDEIGETLKLIYTGALKGAETPANQELLLKTIANRRIESVCGQLIFQTVNNLLVRQGYESTTDTANDYLCELPTAIVRNIDSFAPISMPNMIALINILIAILVQDKDVCIDSKLRENPLLKSRGNLLTYFKTLCSAIKDMNIMKCMFAKKLDIDILSNNIGVYFAFQLVCEVVDDVLKDLLTEARLIDLFVRSLEFTTHNKPFEQCPMKDIKYWFPSQLACRFEWYLRKYMINLKTVLEAVKKTFERDSQEMNNTFSGWWKNLKEPETVRFFFFQAHLFYNQNTSIQPLIEWCRSNLRNLFDCAVAKVMLRESYGSIPTLSNAIVDILSEGPAECHYQKGHCTHAKYIYNLLDKQKQNNNGHRELLSTAVNNIVSLYPNTSLKGSDSANTSSNASNNKSTVTQYSDTTAF